MNACMLSALSTFFVLFCAIVGGGVIRMAPDTEQPPMATEIQMDAMLERMMPKNRTKRMKNMLEASNIKEGQRTANHQAGFAGGCAMNPNCTGITFMTIFHRGRTDFKKRKSYNKMQLQAMLEMYLGGPMGEGVLTGPIELVGLQHDIEMAYNITCLLLQHFGKNEDPELAIEWAAPCQMDKQTKDKAETYIVEVANRMLPRFEDNKNVLEKLSDRILQNGWIPEKEINTFLDQLQ
ncbi:hypothetical protein niasHS_018051 [Heterodera schachtii]|uniref:Uncharacterized protein n=1 Tax=Heterodera schachtii TaxID=97005 RepID=A0ABD2HWD1_HETSC